MADITINVSMGGYRSEGVTGLADQIEIHVPIPDGFALGFEYRALLDTTASKTVDLIAAVRAEPVVGAEVVDSEPVTDEAATLINEGGTIHFTGYVPKGGKSA